MQFNCTLSTLLSEGDSHCDQISERCTVHNTLPKQLFVKMSARNPLLLNIRHQKADKEPDNPSGAARDQRNNFRNMIPNE